MMLRMSIKSLIVPDLTTLRRCPIARCDADGRFTIQGRRAKRAREVTRLRCRLLVPQAQVLEPYRVPDLEQFGRTTARNMPESVDLRHGTIMRLEAAICDLK